jgi:hypothetical protein
MSIARYREAKNALALLDTYITKSQLPGARWGSSVNVALQTKNASSYFDNVPAPDPLTNAATQHIRDHMPEIVAAYRAGLVSRIAELHHSACVEACSIITEEPPK